MSCKNVSFFKVSAHICLIITIQPEEEERSGLVGGWGGGGGGGGRKKKTNKKVMNVQNYALQQYLT